MGFCTEEEYLEFLRASPAFRGDAGASGTRAGRVTGSLGAGRAVSWRFLQRIDDPTRALEAVADGSEVARENGRLITAPAATRECRNSPTHRSYAFWHVVVDADTIKKRARHRIASAHLLRQVPYQGKSPGPPSAAAAAAADAVLRQPGRAAASRAELTGGGRSRGRREGAPSPAVVARKAWTPPETDGARLSLSRRRRFAVVMTPDGARARAVPTTGPAPFSASNDDAGSGNRPPRGAAAGLDDRGPEGQFRQVARQSAAPLNEWSHGSGAWPRAIPVPGES